MAKRPAFNQNKRSLFLPCENGILSPGIVPTGRNRFMKEPMDSSLELKVPPPLVGIALAAIMYLIAWLLPVAHVSVHWALIAAIAGVGLGLDIAGFLAFRRAQTTVNPLKPDSAAVLVTDGIYMLTRNPMYLGLTLILTAWALLLGNILSFLGVPALVLYLTRFQIIPEERAMSLLFGAEYEAYCNDVRRWI